MLTPAGVLLVWFRGMLSVGIVAGAAWLFYEWAEKARRPEPLPQPVDVVTEPVPIADPRFESTRRQLSDWRPGWDEETALLGGAIALMLLSVGGRLIGPGLFRKRGPRIPDMGAGTKLKLQRPDGTVLSVAVFGSEGPTIVATHGWGADSQEWAYLQRAVESGFRVIVWDLPGLGHSSRPQNDDYSLEKFAHDLRAVIDVAGSHPVVLAGHSIGGMTTLTFCRLFPELLGSRVAGLVLVHTTYRNPVRTMRGGSVLSAIQTPVIVPLLYLQIVLSPLIWLSNCLSYWNGSVHWSNTFSGFGGTESREKLDFICRYSLTASPAVLARGCFGMLKYDARDVLPQIAVPVLVVSGEQDPVTLPQASSKIASDVPAGRRLPFSPAKHYGFFEHDEVFQDAISEFCSRVFSAPAVGATR